MTYRNYILRQIALWAVILLFFVHAGISQSQETFVPEQPLSDQDSGLQQLTAAGEDISAAEQKSSQSLFRIVRQGGIVMIPLLVCSFVLTIFVFERFMSLRRGRVIPGPFVERFIQQLKDRQLDREQAMELCQENDSPVARIFLAAVRKWGRPAVEMEQAIIDAGERVSNDLRRYIRTFNGISTIAPLLGLLGTVFGMIQSFDDISSANAMGRPELLAKGISEALLTTATGLVIAIPALIFYWYFVGRVDRLIVEIDALGQEIVHAISLEGLQEAPPVRRRKTTEKDKPEAKAA